MRDVVKTKTLADARRHELGFVYHATLKQAAREKRLFVAELKVGCTLETVGFVHFRCSRDGHATIYEIAVAPEWRGKGVGRQLLNVVVAEAQNRGCVVLRLKCPADLPANGFYARLGFTRVAIEEGKRRPLALWEMWLPRKEPSYAPALQFFATLTNHPKAVRDVLRLWENAGNTQDPFQRVVFTPLFSSPKTRAIIRSLKEERGSAVMFDSGGYQVQMGKVTYEELFDCLLGFYRENDWADWYVLPDHVPRSTDSNREVEFKVRETLDFARLFLRMMPDGFGERAVGVVHGRTEEQVCRCAEAYAEMGVNYVGFGSFSTSGPNGAVNLLSQKNLRLLRLVQALAAACDLRLHIFGIGSPNHLTRLANAGIIPTSFDSAGWWKAAGFGKVFFPGGSQLHITRVDRLSATQRGIERERHRTQHSCPFCADGSVLRDRRIMRVMHNLAAMLDTVERVVSHGNGSIPISRSTERDA